MTLNPCLDKTLTTPAWKPGDSVRGLSVREVVGGKGNNVARALKRLGRSARPVTFLGGSVGETCRAMLKQDDGLDLIAIETEAPTRVILTVLTQGTTDQTAFFDPDPKIQPEEAKALTARVEKSLALPDVEALTLSGSSPSAATHSLYSDLIGLAHARGIPVFLDTYGPALEAIGAFWPTAIQLNRREAAGRLRKPSVTDADVLGLLADWRGRGVTCGIVTDGPDPVLIQYEDRQYRAAPPSIEVVNPIGSGDSMLAGLVDGWLTGGEPETIVRHAIACAAANASVWDAGAVDPETVERLEAEIKLEPI
ncbi:1-phosphofructokinase family hexose kinase [Paludisphaera borealis]|uniref:1-phosphofructokinase family hexose kinase n=1 Tax=Paludisphaera borealis TaxID=1387353 RepID=UPI001F3F202F|nr:PfkB family carbohydrate kinase [Paludisphaera borealis]